MDTNFKNCQSIYEKLSKLLEHVDIKQVGDIKHINEKLLTLSSDMYKLLCVAESIFIYDQKIKGNSVTNFIFKGIEYLDNVTSNATISNLCTTDLNATKMKTTVVERHVQCNVQNNIPSNLVQLPLKETVVQKDTKTDQTSKVSKEDDGVSNITVIDLTQPITGKIRSEIQRSILYNDSGYTCNLCSVTMKNIEDVVSHVSSREHTDICKDPSACFDNILKDCNIGAFWSFVPLYLKICKIYIKPTEFTCTLCKCSIPINAHGVYIHISGKKHLNKVPPCLQLEK